jgi:hypothetical protein
MSDDRMQRKILAMHRSTVLRDKYLLYFHTVQYCKWFERVWTWQESTLPSKILFCSEQSRGYRYDPFDHEFLKKLLPNSTVEYLVGDMIADDIIREMVVEEEEEMSERAFIVSFCITRMMFSSKRHDNIWDNIRNVTDSYHVPKR